MAKQKLGQNFLHDKNTAARIVNTVPGSGATILEIGPGKGIMTELLAVSPGHKRIIAIEKDTSLYNNLMDKYLPGVELLNTDILEVDLKELNAGEELTILGNIPYYISKEIIDWIIKWNELIIKGTFMVQKEFYQKITSKPGIKIYNAQSVMFGILFDSKKEFNVAPGAFSPPPKVTSTVFTFSKRGYNASRVQVPIPDDLQDFYVFLKTAFSQRRKTMTNNLGKDFDKTAIRKFLESNNLPLNIRAEDITPENLRSLYQALSRAPIP